MDDLKKVAVEENVSETTDQTKSPQVEAPSTETQTPPDAASPEGVPDEPKFQNEDERRAFQEQRLEIKRLKEEKAARVKSESAFAPFRVVPQVNTQGVSMSNFTDPLTGETNWSAYDQAVNARIQHAEQIAVSASQSVRDELDEAKARQEHPELFSDPDVEQEIADRWFAAKMRGENATISSVADVVARRFAKAVSKAEKIGAEKALEEVSPKERAALSASSQTSAPSKQSQSDEEFEKLRLQSRGGSLSSDTESSMAIAQRMKNIPWANK